MIKVLLAEDDPNLGELLKDYLEAKGFEVFLAVNGELAIIEFLKNPYSICVLDIMMPKKDGFTLAKEIRNHNADIPIIFLTAKALKEDTLKGFEIGADDYLTKPFVMEELIYRIKAILKRTNLVEKEPKSSILTIGDYTLETTQRILTRGTENNNLTTKEAALLQLFFENLNEAVSRSYALKLIWGDDSYFNARSMDVYITKLRKHLKDDPNLKIINVHGEGFKLIQAKD